MPSRSKPFGSPTLETPWVENLGQTSRSESTQLGKPQAPQCAMEAALRHRSCPCALAKGQVPLQTFSLPGCGSRHRSLGRSQILHLWVWGRPVSRSRIPYRALGKGFGSLRVEVLKVGGTWKGMGGWQGMEGSSGEPEAEVWGHMQRDAGIQGTLR